MELDIIGDSSLFTRLGKGVTYLLRADGSEYLVDCGATPFLALGHERIGGLRGLISTHSHEDHRRWFTDLVLYLHYHPALQRRLRLVTSEAIHVEFEKNSKGALERSLSADSRTVVDVPYADFVEQIVIGPRAKYRMEYRVFPDAGEGRVWRVVEAATGKVVSPAKAKVFVNPRANRPRMLFKDPVSGEWVEPESFYPFSSAAFFEEDRNDYVDQQSGLTFRAVKAAAWHGPPTIGVLATRGEERIAFSSDTVYDPELWRELVETRHPRHPDLDGSAFEKAYVMEGEINEYVERTWGRERLDEAMRCYDGAIVVHDADFERSVVHTSHSKFTPDVDWKRLLLTHTPDGFASAHPITVTGKRYHLAGGDIFEVVGDGDGRKDHPLDADLYFKQEDGSLWVGYAAPEGRGRLWETGRGLVVGVDTEEAPAEGAKLQGRYDVYVDVDGHYLPPLPSTSSGRARYLKRADGWLELVVETPEGSRGQIVDDLRAKIHSTARTQAFRTPEERRRLR
jgi:ribonuclease BN (tRNA processing enzyme)